MQTYEQLFDQIVEDREFLQNEIEKAVSLDHTNLASSMYQQSSLMMTWSYMASMAASRAERDKYILQDAVLPRVRDRIRTGAGKITVQAVEDLASMDQEVISAAGRYRDSQELADILRKVEFALSHKRDMIQTINSRQRMDMRVAAE